MVRILFGTHPLSPFNTINVYFVNKKMEKGLFYLSADMEFDQDSWKNF